jgi:hypothetical protein
MADSSISRRRFVVAAGFSGFATPTIRSAVAGPDRKSGDLHYGNKSLVKILASLDGTAAPWWFAGYLYAIPPGERPIAMVRCEGCEVYFPQRQENGDYLLGGATLTFFRDVASGEWLEEFQNPITGRRNAVKPNSMQSAPKAGFLYPADDSAPHFFGPMGNSGQLAYKPPERPGTPPLGEMRWERVGDTVFVTTSRGLDTPAQPWMEVSTSITSAAALGDSSTTRVAASGAVSYASPWLRWMDMEGVPGNVMWHAATQKLASLEELPAGYREHAAKLGLLKTLKAPNG